MIQFLANVSRVATGKKKSGTLSYIVAVKISSQVEWKGLGLHKIFTHKLNVSYICWSNFNFLPFLNLHVTYCVNVNTLIHSFNILWLGTGEQISALKDQ